MDDNSFIPVNDATDPRGSSPTNPTDQEPSALEDLAASIKTYHQAIEEEFEIAAKDGDPSILVDLAHKKMALAFPKAVERIVNLVEFAEKDSTAFSAAKFIYEEVKSALAGEDNSPLAKLLAQISLEANTPNPNIVHIPVNPNIKLPEQD
jgi:hypothetical protein